MKKQCSICGQIYIKKVNVSKTNWEKSKYCSWACMAKSKIGNTNRLGISYPAWNKGIPGLKGKDNGSWKGNKASYSAKHKWIESLKGRPNKCEHCQNIGFKSRQIHWANKDHKYNRNLKDWMRLCAKCHTVYDKKHNLR